MSQYLVTTPNNPDYNGKAFGVRFEKGRAHLSDYSIDKSLGLSVDEIAERMEKDLGYSVEPVEGDTWVKELELAVDKKGKKRGKASAGEALEDSVSEA